MRRGPTVLPLRNRVGDNHAPPTPLASRLPLPFLLPLPLRERVGVRGPDHYPLATLSPSGSGSTPTCHSRRPTCHSRRPHLSFPPSPLVIPAAPPCHSRRQLAGIQGLFFCSVGEALQQGRASPGPSGTPHPGLGFPMNNVGNDRGEKRREGQGEKCREGLK